MEKSKEKSLALVQDPIIKDLIKNCDAEFIGDIYLTPKEVSELKKYAIMIKYGDHNLIPMICTGERCIGRARCPLLKFGKSPVGKECPFERFALNQWREDYIESLEVDVKNKVERQQILDLVEADILNARANVVLGDEGFIMENPVGVDESTGEPITRREEHIALRLKERAQNRKDKILKAFLATREQKLKAISAARKDATEYLANLRAKLREATETHNAAISKENIQDADVVHETKDKESEENASKK